MKFGCSKGCAHPAPDATSPVCRMSSERIPDETIILNFRHLLGKHELAVYILGVLKHP